MSGEAGASAAPPSFAVSDFEASSLDENSYPIEVGLAVVRNGTIESWARVAASRRPLSPLRRPHPNPESGHSSGTFRWVPSSVGTRDFPTTGFG
jgi:hypothetical protein